jgi:signal peptidase I
MDKEILKEINKRKLFYIITVVMFVLYFFIRLDFLAILGALFFIIGVVSESFVNAKEKGIKSEFKERIIAIVIALALWYGATFILNTDMPFNAVVSCSMLDTLHRGDVIVLHGVRPNVNEINITLQDYEKMIENNEVNFICGICVDDYGVQTPCSINPLTMEREFGKILKYDCGYCKQVVNGETQNIVCTYGVNIKDKYFDATKKDGDIIVYRPKENDIFSLVGDIIHRGIVRINVEEKSYYLIKGDNNPQFDTQIYDSRRILTNSLVEENQVIGKSILNLPFLGYIKLVASGQIANPPGCDTRTYYE